MRTDCTVGRPSCVCDWRESNIMSDRKTRVGLASGNDRRGNVFAALDLVREEVIPRIADQVLLSPNFLSSASQVVCTHADAIRGAIDFLSSVPEPPAEIVVAEGANEKYSGEAFDNFGYRSLAEEYDIPIRLVDLHGETEWEEIPILLDDRSEVSARMPRLVLDCPCVISVAVAKTHDVTVVTLALKNLIMGSIHKEDRIHMHGFPTHAARTLPAEAQTLNINLIRVARRLCPDIGIVDGTVGIQGNGPGGTDVVDFGAVAASADVFAADAVAAKAMGFEPLELGFLRYAEELGLGVADLERIEVMGASLDAVTCRFKPHESIDQQLQWHDERAGELLQV